MRHFLLAEADTGISQSNVLAIVFVGIVKIALSLYIPAFAFGEEEGIRQVIHIGFHGVQGNDVFSTALLHGVYGGCNLRRIGQRTDRRTQQIKNSRQHILTLDLLPLYNVLQIDLRKQRFQISHFRGIRGTGKNQRHTAVESKIVKSVLLIAANSRVVFGKGKRMHTDLIAAPPELGQYIRGQHFGVASGHINV